MGLERPKLLPDVPPLGVVASNSILAYDYNSHPGYGLTARGLVAAYRDAEWGQPRWQCDLFDDVIESDGHLRSQLESRLKGVSGKPWIVQAGGDSPADVTAARLLEDALRKVPNTNATIVHQLKSVWYGWSASEIVWEMQGGVVVPVWFANVPHNAIIFDRDRNPRLWSPETFEGVPLERGRWWIATNGSNHVPARAGLMRTAAWWSLFKRMAVRDSIVYAERFGIPYVTGEYGAGASEADKDVLKAAVQSLGKDGAAVFSEACKILVHSVGDGGKGSDIHATITALCNAEISKLVTGATLTTETAGPGSFALGKVHADAAFALRAADAEELALQFETDVGAAFLAMNHMNARPPRLKINVVPDLDPLTRAQIISILATNVGLQIDEQQIRQEFNLKVPVGKPLVAPTPNGPAGAPVPTGL